MNICVIGTARSGTTAIYTLIQKLLLDNYSPVKFYYEPLLWEPDTFDDLYENVNHSFEFVNNISATGIYHHLKLPLFVENTEKYIHNEYLSDIFSKQDGVVKLSKFIRGNGRIKVLYDIDPECKFIFIIRNPLDVVNSVAANFSFFGGEFHRDDYPRFVKGVNRIFNAGINLSDPVSFLEKQLLFWKYMNQFALEAMNGFANKTLILAQEEVSLNTAAQVKRICEYLGVPFLDKYTDTAKERKSEVTKVFKCSKRELDHIMPYLKEYFIWLNNFRIGHSFSEKNILGKYELAPADVFSQDELYGASPLVLLKKIKELKDKPIEKTRGPRKLKFFFSGNK
jgi:hypothetical protein